EYVEIKSQVSERKENIRLYPYRFKTANTEERKVTIEANLGKGMFSIKESDIPIKLAGVTTKELNEYEQGLYDNIIGAGDRVTIKYDQDPVHQVSNVPNPFVRAAVFKGTMNVNKMLIRDNLVEEDEEAFDPAAVRARFNPWQISFGRAWESMSHINSIPHSKFLQVRSALESYERRDLYGKDFQKWSNPVRDYLKPAVQQNIARKHGIIIGAVVGATFGHRSLYGKLLGGIAGATTVAIGQAMKLEHQVRTGEKWIPERRKEERELNEYIDMLKFVKYRKLYSDYKAAAEKLYGEDVDQQIKISDYNRTSQLYSVKNQLEKGVSNSEARKLTAPLNLKYGGSTAKALIDSINREIIEIGKEKRNSSPSEMTKMAMYYYNLSEKTMYGYDENEPLTNILYSLPKRDRNYFKGFLNAPEEERMKILQVAPKYMRRPLEAAWGIEVEEKANIVEYFKQHQLPGVNWAGWREDVDLDAVKVKIIKKEGRDAGEYDVWDRDIQAADDAGRIPIPYVYKRESGQDITRRMRELLGEIGMDDMDIQYVMTEGDMDIRINLTYDRKRDIEQYIRENEGEFLR
ncbi:MAG: hypothetical protein ACQ5SW_12280, partial [Sphaerochaetaceae bacterium]